MSWMMGMKTHFGAGRTFAALDTHLKRPFTANAEFKLTLGACKMHAATLGQRIPEFAVGTLDSMFLQVFFDSFSLIIGIIGFFPCGEVFT